MEDINFFLVHEGGKEDWLELVNFHPIAPPAVRITEYENIQLVLRSREEINPWLYIEDIEVGRPQRYATDLYIEYRWRPDEGDSWFLNHFGYSILEIDVSTQLESKLALHSIIEVFATKLNAERAEQILIYLENRLDDVTRSCFNATHKRAEALEEGNISVSVLLQTIEEHLKLTSHLLPNFRNRKRKRLTPTLTQISPNATTPVTEHSVGWVLSHLDTLLPATHKSLSSITIGGLSYELDQIETDILVEDTNVYENQVIAGYLKDVSERLFEIDQFYSKQLALVESEGFVAEIPDGFSSIFEVKRKFGRKYYGQLLSLCRELQKVCLGQSAFFQKHLPVKVTVKAMPRLTSGFLASPHYYQSFQQITRWYRIGRLNTFGERYLYGMRTLDKLYEFFCLFRLLETMRSCGWHIVSQRAGARPTRRQASPEWNVSPDSIYNMQNAEGDVLTLLYEPVVDSRTNPLHNLVSVSHTSKYEPDFVVEVRSEAGAFPLYAIIDAKYTTPSKALYIGTKSRYEDYLTKTTMKYLHGIGSQGSVTSPVKAVFVMHPKGFHEAYKSVCFRSYHAKPFDMFSNQRVFPMLGAIEVSPEKPEVLENITGSTRLADVVAKMIESIQLHN